VNGDGFPEIYPMPHTGPPLRAHDVKDWAGVKGDESRLKRCRFCGFICDPTRDMRVKDGSFAGKGISHGSQQSDTYTVGGKSVTDYYYEPTVDAGCPFCGSYRWDS
jgi:hypothetical protein